MSSLHGSLDKKIVRATWNFKMADTLVEQLSDSDLIGDTSMKIGMSSLWVTWQYATHSYLKFQDGDTSMKIAMSCLKESFDTTDSPSSADTSNTLSKEMLIPFSWSIYKLSFSCLRIHRDPNVYSKWSFAVLMSVWFLLHHLCT